jgi:hypothetical protein
VRSRSYIDSDAGYTPDFFAFKRGLTIQQAVRLIQAVGPSRARLDAAASMPKQQLALDGVGEVAMALNGSKSRRLRKMKVAAQRGGLQEEKIAMARHGCSDT